MPVEELAEAAAAAALARDTMAVDTPVEPWPVDDIVPVAGTATPTPTL